jgi:D-glycero-D-manno-heptose 1,7-bisphosphate phosphatase
MSSTGLTKAVFLDRDGTLNVDHGYVYRPDDLELIPRAVEALVVLQDAGFKLIVVTNQSGVARGMFTESDVAKFHDELTGVFAKSNVILDGFYFCPHHPEGEIQEYTFACTCRKPGSELFIRAAGEHDIDIGKSYAIGDRMRDVSPVIEIGGRGVLIDPAVHRPMDSSGFGVAPSLYEASRLVLSDGT